MNQSSLVFPVYREISLQHGLVTRVSAHRYGFLNQWKWYAKWSDSMDGYYAVRPIVLADRTATSMLMSRVIMGLDFGDLRTVDHANHDTLDNTDHNLRFATRAQQQYNRWKREQTSSRFKGVYYAGNKWIAGITIDGVRLHLGTCDTEEEAYLLYTMVAEPLHGEFLCQERKPEDRKHTKIATPKERRDTDLAIKDLILKLRSIPENRTVEQ